MLPKKEITKIDRELCDNHRKCCITYLVQQGVSHRAQKKFLILYDREVNEDNIMLYYHRPIKLFVCALLRNQLNKITYYCKI